MKQLASGTVKKKQTRKLQPSQHGHSQYLTYTFQPRTGIIDKDRYEWIPKTVN